MAIQDLISKIILEDQFSKAFDDYEKRLTATDAKTGKFKSSLGGLAVGFGVVVGGLAAAAVALDELTSKAVENQTAMFNVGAAAAAANDEFGNSVGTVESWTNSVKATSDQLRVFGDQDVANATARLIDMTKRLGLTEGQMKILIARTGDLSAGKTTLEGGIERVTAAMRGEAESAEFLGLSLSETQVKAYAEAHGLVWKELSDAEKVQVRYQAFLAQTDDVQGRAAESAKTLAGQEAELARLRERELADLGGQLLPLRQGEIELWKLLASTTQESGGIITNVLAGLTATMITFGATATTIINSQVDNIKMWAGSYQAVWQAIQDGRSPLEAISKIGLDAAKNNAEAVNAITSFSDTWSTAFEQVRSSYNAASQAQTDFNIGTEQGTTKQSEFATAGQAAASTIAQAYQDLAADREKLQTGLNQKLEAAEFDHAQRIIRIQQDIARATAEAAAEAAAAREKAAASLATGLAEIDRTLAADNLAAQADYNRDIAKLDQERAATKKKAAQEIRKLESDLKTDLRTLRRDTAQEISDINSDLADDLADKAGKAEEDKNQIIQNAGKERVQIEKSIADQRKAVQEQFSSEFADADPFRRQILEFNRQEQLKQLDQQEKDEKAALDAQTQSQLSAIDARVAAEAAILEREAQQKRDRAAREAADRAEALRQEAAERKAAIESRLAEELAADAQRRADLAASLAAEQAQRAAAAEEARAKLQQKNAEELAAIDKQEADKVTRAQEALARENENYADKLGQLRFANQQEVSELNSKLAKVEQDEIASYTRRLQEARSFASQQSAILNGGSANRTTTGTPFAGFAEGGIVPGPAGRPMPAIVHGGETVLPEGVKPQQITNNNVTVNNYGAPGGYAGASQTGRTVIDALRGR